MNAARFPDLKVGDQLALIYVGHRQGDRPIEYAVIVSKIGRRWVYLKDRGERFDIEDGIVDAGEYASNGRVYRSRAEFNTAVALRQHWQTLKSNLQYGRVPPGLTFEKLEEAARLLGVDLGPRP